MKITSRLTLPYIVLAVFLAGCASSDDGDPSPLPKQDTQASVDRATKNVESSNMTPEQKQAAAQYLKQGAANAERMRKSAQVAGAGGN